MTQAQELLEELYPARLIYEGKELDCARGGVEWEMEREAGGFQDESEARVRVRMELMPARPKKNAPVILDGRDYAVDDVARAVGDEVWCLALRRK